MRIHVYVCTRIRELSAPGLQGLQLRSPQRSPNPDNYDNPDNPDNPVSKTRVYVYVCQDVSIHDI